MHRFELESEVFGPLGEQLSLECMRQRSLSSGITVSNVDGWHSQEVIFTCRIAASVCRYSTPRTITSGVLRRARWPKPLVQRRASERAA